MNIMMTHTKSRGFTLVELLVVISVVALISSVAMYSTAQARAKAEDAKKRAEVGQVQVALALHKDSRGRTPLNYSCSGTFCGGGTGDSVAIEGSQAFNSSMQELVSSGYLTAIPKSKDASYVYYADATAQKAAFGAELKGQSPTATAAVSSRSYCSSVPAPYTSCVNTMSTGNYVPAQPGPGVVVFRDGEETRAFCRIYGTPSTAQCSQGGNGQFQSACFGQGRLAYGESNSSLSAENAQNTGSIYLAQSSGGVGGLGGLGGGFSGGGPGGLIGFDVCNVRAIVDYDITCTLSNANVAPTCSGGSADDFCTCVE